MAPVCWLMQWLDLLDVDTGYTIFGDIYYRYYVWSDYIPISQLVFFVTAWIVGFAFINQVNLRGERGNPFKSIDGSFKDIKLTIFYAFVFYFISGLVILRQKYDFSNYCLPPQNTTLDSFRASIVPPAINHTAAIDMPKPLH